MVLVLNLISRKSNLYRQFLYHLKLDTIQVLVWNAKVLLLPLVRLLVRLLLPPAVLAASHPNNQGNEAETI